MNIREITKQHRLKQWMEIIRECRSSGQTISAWCSEHNVNHKSYYYWLKRVRIATCESLPLVGANNQQIVPVKMPAPLMETSSSIQESSSPIVLRFGSVTLELHNGASSTLIENALKAIQNVR